jgi:hypothetical protein
MILPQLQKGKQQSQEQDMQRKQELMQEQLWQYHIGVQQRELQQQQCAGGEMGSRMDVDE